MGDMDTMHEVLHGYQPPFPIGEGICMLAITQLNTLTSGIDVVLGQHFLHTVYTVFSMEDPPHIAIGKLECSDDKDDDNLFRKVMIIVLGIVFLGILGKVMIIVLGIVFLGILLCLFRHSFCGKVMSIVLCVVFLGIAVAVSSLSAPGLMLLLNVPALDQSGRIAY